MTDVPDGPDPSTTHHALVGLHALADGLGGVDPGALPGFVPLVPAVALRTVAEAPVEQVPVSARVGVLYSLASKDFPHYEGNEDAYRALADSVAQQRTGVDAEQLLSDVKAAAAGDTSFEKTASGQASAGFGAPGCSASSRPTPPSRRSPTGSTPAAGRGAGP